MLVKLLYPAGQEMRLLSSIIKGGRIREQKIINLSERFSAVSGESEITDFSPNQETSLVPQQEEIVLLEEQINLMHEKASAVLREAEGKAKEIIEAALQQAKEIKETVQEEKINLLNETFNQQNKMIETAKKEAEQIVQDAQTEKKHIIGNIEEELAQTLMSLLQYLIGEEVYRNIDWLLCIVKKMLSNDVFKEEIKVFISPAMYNKLTEENKETIKAIKNGVTLHSLDTMKDTSCRVETEEGAIEYDIKDGLDRVISDIDILKNLKQEYI
ncbi:MAG: hypothetical protein K0R69_1203 [Clostridia bacterium]|nr:hypothetical protein [Clostridia bacterium]